MRTHVYIASSLDGFIARAGGELDWLQELPDEGQNDYGFSAFMARMDAVLMGRNTFETARHFSPWPYTKPVFVLSGSAREMSAAFSGRAEFIRGDPQRVLEMLEALGMENLYIDGGRTIQGFLEKDLIDEMTITTVSRLLGGGIPLFAGAGRDLAFKLVDSERLNEHMVKNHYVRAR
jgi:dihydrofolate reductase